MKHIIQAIQQHVFVMAKGSDTMHPALKFARNNSIIAEYEQGNSFESIAKRYNITRQRVQQIVEKGVEIKNSNKSIYYYGIRNWINNNSMNINSFYELMHIKYENLTYATLYNFLSGSTKGNIELIKMILEVTGLTFESAFFEDAKNQIE